MKLDLIKVLSNLFTNRVSIEKTYNVCDKALAALREYNKNKEAYQGERKLQLEESVAKAERLAKALLGLEAQKSWPGVFRELHGLLARIYVEQEKYDEAIEECHKMAQYGEVGRSESAEITEDIAERRKKSTTPSV